MRCEISLVSNAISCGLALVVYGPTTPERAHAQNMTPVAAMRVYALVPAQDVEIRGLIIARRGDDMHVREGSSPGTMYIVTLTDNTQVVAPSGLMMMSKKHYDQSVLVPGLAVTVEATRVAPGKLVATRVKFAKAALKVAQQITAGGEVVKAQVAANRDSIEEAKERARDSLAKLQAKLRERLANLDEYDVRLATTVTFATASAELGAAAKSQLDDLAAKGKGMRGYLVEVAGYADTTGSSAVNQDLSRRRADAVVAYLVETHDVPLRRILNPAGLGTSNAAATNATSAGRAQNRRVEVRVLVNRGLRP